MIDDSEIFSLTGLEISEGLAQGNFSSEEVTLAFLFHTLNQTQQL